MRLFKLLIPIRAILSKSGKKMIKYGFTKTEENLRKYYEKKYKRKISDEAFYKYIQESKKWLAEFIEVIKKWQIEKPWEAEQLIRFMDKWEKKEKEEKLQKKLTKIKKLTITELKNFLTPILKKEGYIKLDFSKPEINKDVIVKFTVQDNKTDRDKYDSRIQLQRLFKKKLANTNWRLMSDGIYYKLGILSGRLRGYENVSDLAKYRNKN